MRKSRKSSVKQPAKASEESQEDKGESSTAGHNTSLEGPGRQQRQTYLPQTFLPYVGPRTPVYVQSQPSLYEKYQEPPYFVPQPPYVGSQHLSFGSEQSPYMGFQQEPYLELHQQPYMEHQQQPYMEPQQQPYMESQEQPYIETQQQPLMEPIQQLYTEAQRQQVYVEPQQQQYVEPQQRLYTGPQQPPYVGSQHPPYVESKQQPYIEPTQGPYVGSRPTSYHIPQRQLYHPLQRKPYHAPQRQAFQTLQHQPFVRQQHPPYIVQPYQKSYSQYLADNDLKQEDELKSQHMFDGTAVFRGPLDTEVRDMACQSEVPKSEPPNVVAEKIHEPPVKVAAEIESLDLMSQTASNQQGKRGRTRAPRTKDGERKLEDRKSLRRELVQKIPETPSPPLPREETVITKKGALSKGMAESSLYKKEQKENESREREQFEQTVEAMSKIRTAQVKHAKGRKSREKGRTNKKSKDSRKTKSVEKKLRDWKTRKPKRSRDSE
ncbi:hypothetical protein BIW11_00612 [Tropilaelaps mercedesae]|uniref:Uncharacterized protein n=1 Tax=Tropilaelaps mercedesae TaxID=418985 RepID=A0A1V9XSE1_9ACAR|nr:hypothetical protein BIW11_00612 [Tropilaelaps mercedesae]